MNGSVLLGFFLGLISGVAIGTWISMLCIEEWKRAAKQWKLAYEQAQGFLELARRSK